MDDSKLSEARNRIEATLFSSGDKLSLEDLSRLTRIKEEDVIREALRQLEAQYNQKDSSIELVTDGKSWKLHVRPRYLNIARRLGVKTEISKTIVETLAIVAWRAPVLQSDIIKVRTNKAYDHLDELESQGFITRSRFGRSRMIKLAKKFFDYFELDEETMRQMVQRTVQKAETMDVKMKKTPGEEDALPPIGHHDDPIHDLPMIVPQTLPVEQPQSLPVEIKDEFPTEETPAVTQPPDEETALPHSEAMPSQTPAQGTESKKKTKK